MSREPDITAEHSELAEDAAAWVLGALEPGESERFGEHLRRCVVCRDDVVLLQGAVELLPLSIGELAPPRGLNRRIKRSVREAVRQDAELRSRSRRPARRRPLMAGGFAAALAAGAFAVVQLASSPTSAPQTRVVQARVLTRTGDAYLSLRDGHAELVVRGMPAPPLDKIYEVWLKRPGRRPAPTSALFNVTSNGAGSVDVPGSLRGVQEVLVTPEPLGGSRTPTYPPVITATLRRS